LPPDPISLTMTDTEMSTCDQRTPRKIRPPRCKSHNRASIVARNPTSVGCSLLKDEFLKKQPVAHRFVCQVCGFTGMSRLSLSRHVSKAHRPRRCIRPSRPRCVEAAIYQTLKLLLSKTRRKLLEQFSEAQRLASEQWILAQPIVPSCGLKDQLFHGPSRHSMPTLTTTRCGLPSLGKRDRWAFSASLRGWSPSMEQQGSFAQSSCVHSLAFRGGSSGQGGVDTPIR